MKKNVVFSICNLVFTLIAFITILCNVHSTFVIFYMMAFAISLVFSILSVKILMDYYGITFIINVKDTDEDIERKLKLRQEHYNYTQDDLYKDLEFLERIISGGWDNQEQRDTISALIKNFMTKWKDYSMYRHQSIEDRFGKILLSLH